MFTGLIESTGVITSIRNIMDIREMDIEGASFIPDLKIGDSVAVSGVCLTVTRKLDKKFSVEMMPETIRNTMLGSITRGFRVNLERSMKASGRFEGHIVTGHVDTIGRVSSIQSRGRSRELEVDIDPHLSRYVAQKGSIALQGVSLTVINSNNGRLWIGLIPQTIESTTMGDLVAGSIANIEFDIVSKYIEALFSGKPGEGNKPLTMDYLGEMGWV